MWRRRCDYRKTYKPVQMSECSTEYLNTYFNQPENILCSLSSILLFGLQGGCELPEGLVRMILDHFAYEGPQEIVGVLLMMDDTRDDLWERDVPLHERSKQQTHVCGWKGRTL